MAFTFASGLAGGSLFLFAFIDFGLLLFDFVGFGIAAPWAISFDVARLSFVRLFQSVYLLAHLGVFRVKTIECCLSAAREFLELAVVLALGRLHLLFSVALSSFDHVVMVLLLD